MSTVTATRRGSYAPRDIRNGSPDGRPEAVTATRRGPHDAIPGAVTCKVCREPVPSEHPIVVVRLSGAAKNVRSGDKVCIGCANASYGRLLLPWVGPGVNLANTRADYTHRCPWCGRAFYGAVLRRCCSDECAEARRNARRSRASTRRGRQCATCSATFTPTPADARYCSSPCRQKAYRTRAAGRDLAPIDARSPSDGGTR